jgi:uncharacterized protein (TIGR02996 family)
MSPPPGHEPFLRAICEVPDDDAPRLVYADWLDENGDTDRAEFIRTHVQLARNPENGNAERRCVELFRANGRKWASELPGPGAWWVEHPGLFARRHGHAEPDTWGDLIPALKDWDRGFPANLFMQGSALGLAAYGWPIGELVPVRRLYLVHAPDADAVVRVLVDLPLLAALRDLVVPWAMLSDDAVTTLAESPRAANLKYIALEAGRLTDRAADALADSPNLASVEVLHLLHSQFDDATKARLRARFGFAVHC